MESLLSLIDKTLEDAPDALTRKRLEVIKSIMTIQDMEALKFLAGFVRGYLLVVLVLILPALVGVENQIYLVR